MIAFFLLTLAGGAIGIKMYRAVEKKKYTSEMERLESRCMACHKLALATQTDFVGRFSKRKKGWVFETECVEDSSKSFSPIELNFSELLLNGKAVKRELVIDFFSSGQIVPKGTLSFKHPSMQTVWETSKIFQRDEGVKLGPLHPNQ